MSPDRMTVIEWLSQADAQLSLAAQAVTLAEDEIRPFARYAELATEVEEIRQRVDAARKSIRSLSGQVRTSLPIEAQSA